MQDYDYTIFLYYYLKKNFLHLFYYIKKKHFIMIINSIEFKNIKSYGNKLQKLTFDEKGKLILLTGTNGGGKSTIQDSIDLSLFNQVRGKETTKIPLRKFPNRINKELCVSINFNNNNNDIIDIERKIQPNNFIITKNNEPYTERFKLMTEEEREKIIGFNYNTFKSFISLSMNDFRNFIHLNPEDKRNLLNKLFNLEEIDSYYSINKELIYQNKKEIEHITSDIVNIDKILKEYTSILKDKKATNIESKDEIKNNIIIKKEVYNKKKEELRELNIKISDFLVNIQEFRNKSSVLENENIKRRTELTDINDKIIIYEGGNCPYCSSNLEDDIHQGIYSELKEKKTFLKDLIFNNQTYISIYKDEIFAITKQQKVLESSRDLISDEIIDLKADCLILKDKYENYKDSIDDIYDNLKEKGSNLLKEKRTLLERISLLKDENSKLNELKEYLSEDGVRKEIISSIIPPINEKLSKFLDKIKFPYDVVLNDSFDAIITDKGEEFDSEMMSNGENRMVNLCIAISYIEMIRKMNKINVLFMDEVFASIHKENINLILDLLKDFSRDNNLNLILVHHGLEDVNPKFFDKIISVEKNLFSDIIITNN